MDRLSERFWHDSTARGQFGGRLALLGLMLVSLFASVFGFAPDAALAAPPGGVLIWGDNRSGQLGSGAIGVEQATPNSIPGTSPNTIAVAGGRYHSLSLTTDGTVISWGSNFPYGQLGRGSQADRLDPGPITGLSGVTAIAAFGSNNLALSGGTVYRWGSDGRFESRSPVQVQGLSGMLAIGAGFGHSLAVAPDNTVRSWGRNGFGQLGDNSSTERAMPVSVVGVGGQGVLGGIIAVAGGENHTLALGANGQVYAWGGNTQGQLGTGAADTSSHPQPLLIPGLSNITAIAAGYRHSLALRADGTVFAWGDNDEGESGTGTLGGGQCSCVPSPTPVGGAIEVTAIAAGEDHSLAVRRDGTVFAWGANDSRQLGLSTPEVLPTATTIPGLATVNLVGGGGAHSLAIHGQTSPVYDLTLNITGPGTVDLLPNGGRYPAGTIVQLIPRPTPGSGAIFAGWTVDGRAVDYSAVLNLTMDSAHTVGAAFVVPPDFCDVASGDPYYEAIRQLAARGVIRGFTSEDDRLCFAPNEPTNRAQMAALVARPLGWDGEQHSNPFTDQGVADPNLWRNVGTLAHYNVATGYKPETCAALGLGVPCYGPTDQVLHAQVISFITRGMVARGYWQAQPDNPALYPNVPADSGHRADLATYFHYVGVVPGTSSPTEDWTVAGQPAPRGWFAEAEWRALSVYFGLTQVP